MTNVDMTFSILISAHLRKSAANCQLLFANRPVWIQQNLARLSSP